MKLHEDQRAFQAIIQSVNELSNMRMDILEKDYYVTLLLKELADKQSGGLPAYFKGGTALYKALGTIQRFSEDIDLTVRVDGCTGKQAKQRLEQSAHYHSLPRTKFRNLEYSNADSISFAYDYEPVVEYDTEDALQRFGHVRIESTSYTVSEPTEAREISAAIYKYAKGSEKELLESLYDVAPFAIETIRAERIFIDKIFASEHYYIGQRYTDVAKHIYDIAIMSQLDFAKSLLGNPEYLREIVAYKRQEESGWAESAVADKPFSEFILAREAAENKDLADAYNLMQEIYIFEDVFKVEYSTVSSILTETLDKIMSGVENN